MRWFVCTDQMVYHYIHGLPHIEPCAAVRCWVRKTISEYFGSWAPVNPDAAFNYNGTLIFVKNSVVYRQFARPSPTRSLFDRMPCDVDAIVQYYDTKNFVMIRGDLLLHGNLHSYLRRWGCIHFSSYTSVFDLQS